MSFKLDPSRPEVDSADAEVCIGSDADWPSAALSCIHEDNGKENGNYYLGLYRGSIGIMEKKMETTI